MILTILCYLRFIKRACTVDEARRRDRLRRSYRTWMSLLGHRWRWVARGGDTHDVSTAAHGPYHPRRTRLSPLRSIRRAALVPPRQPALRAYVNHRHHEPGLR